MTDLGLRVNEAQDRQLWRRKIFGETSEPCLHGKKQTINIDDDDDDSEPLEQVSHTMLSDIPCVI